MKLLSLIAFAAVAPTVALAQFDFGGDSTPRNAWDGFKLPKKTLKLDFRNASVDMVLSLFTKASGITIVKDPTLTQPLTLTTAKAVPLSDAFEVLNAALSLRNYDLRKEGNLLVIRQRQQRRDQGGRGNTPTFTPEMMAAMSQPNTELRTYQIQYASASQVARMINDVFAQQNSPFGGRGGIMFGGRGGMMGGMNPFASIGQQQTQIRASSDDFSNTVIVNATSKVHSQVEEIIKQIDKVSEVPAKVKVYALKFASSDDLQPVVQNVLQANVPRGRGGTGQTSIDRQFAFGGGPFGMFGTRNNQSSGSVVSEARTNSLIVTTTEDNHKIIEDVVKNLDTEVKLESTTFVFPLENAKASDISTLLRQAFGTRSGSGLTGGTSTRTTGTNRTNTRTNNNRSNRSGGIQGNSLNEMVVALADPNADSGELETNVEVEGPVLAQMFGGFGQQQTQQRRTTSSVQTGRDSTGRLVPVQDLTNQVTVIPDQNTNSVIVVTTPENAELIQKILAQLDKIPEQVMIETIIVEASLEASEKLGLEWQYLQNKAFGTTGKTGQANQDFGLKDTDTTPPGFRYTLTGGALTGFLNLFQSDTKFNVLSTPRIFTSNNVEAEINISQRVPFVVSQRTDANGNLTYNYEFEDVGIVLTVTPRITAGGYVTMEVSQTANDLQGFTSFNAPIVNQRQADTTVAVKDGETVILGGIMRSTVTATVNKIPLLGDIPILGNLFKSTNRTNQKTELLVFLTPRVVRDATEAQKLTKEQVDRMSKPSQAQIKKELDARPKPKNGVKAPGDQSESPDPGGKKTGDDQR